MARANPAENGAEFAELKIGATSGLAAWTASGLLRSLCGVEADRATRYEAMGTLAWTLCWRRAGGLSDSPSRQGYCAGRV